METKKTIIAECVKSNRSENLVWKVSIPGRRKYVQYCRNAKSALHYMFLVKSKTGLPLSHQCFQKLMQEIRLQPATSDEEPHVITT